MLQKYFNFRNVKIIAATIVVSSFTFIFYADSKAKKPGRVLFITKSPHEFHATIAKGATRQAFKNNIKLDVIGPDSETDYAFQKNILARVIKTRSYDAVILEPNHSTELLTELSQLDQAKIPFVVVDTPISFGNMEPAHYCGFIGTNNILGGELAAKHLGKKIKRGNIVLVRGLSHHRSSQDREKGFRDALSRFHPGLRIIATLDGEWDGNRSLEEFKKFLKTTTSRIDAVFALNDDMALAIAGYYKDQKRHPLVVGFNGSKEAQKHILLGQMEASIVQMPEEMGIRSLSIALDCLRNNKKPESMETLTPVTALSASRLVNFSND